MGQAFDDPFVNAGLQFGMNLYQNDWSAKQAAIARQSNERTFERSMDWSTQMSNTAHQRQVADMRAAGLNPILSATGGKGAGTPSASGAAAPTPGSADMGNIVSSALNTKRNKAEVDLLQENQANAVKSGRLIEEDTIKRRAEAVNAKMQGHILENEITRSGHTAREAGATADIAESNAKGRKLEGEIDETQFGAAMRYINRAIDPITGGSSAYRNFGGGR